VLIAALWLLGATADTFLRAALDLSAEGPHWALRLYLALAPIAFLVGFWTHGGQTLGMRAWRIRVVDDEGREISMGQGIRRCLYALLSWLPLGLGFIWVAFDRDRAAWHDRLTHTWLVMTSKRR
jgi:uncharacterized RDD family membrane protein YckC